MTELWRQLGVLEGRTGRVEDRVEDGLAKLGERVDKIVMDLSGRIGRLEAGAPSKPSESGQASETETGSPPGEINQN